MVTNLLKASDRRQMGGKAALLAEMKANGFLVPDGFVLGRRIFRRFLEQGGKANEVSEILVGLSVENAGEKSWKLEKALSGLHLPRELLDELAKRVRPGIRYAVRSSGILEDLEDLSFAGQYATCLHVDAMEGLERAILNCYRSLYSPALLGYLADHGLGGERLEMAVLIQEMVDADKSGVAFTVNPVTGADKEIIAEVSAGLGDALASGRVTPESYRYHWDKDVYTCDPANRLLNRRELEELMQAALAVQVHLGYPCDIEFAFEAGRLYLLQVRPITKILHTGIKGQWTTANFKDGGVSSSVCTAYMWSLYEYIWEQVLRRFFRDSHLLKEKEMGKLGNMFFSRPYWNVGTVKLAVQKAPGYSELGFDSELGIEITYEGEGRTFSAAPKTMGQLPGIAWKQLRMRRKREKTAPRLRDRLLHTYRRHLCDAGRQYTPDELAAQWRQLVERDYFRSESTYFMQIFLNTVHLPVFKNALLRHVGEAEYLTLIGGLHDISHLRPVSGMWRISRSIAADPQSRRFWLDTPTAQIKELYGQSTDAYCLGDIRRYIAEYGYHSARELSVDHPCYAEDIDSVLELCRETVRLGDEYAPSAGKERHARARILQELRGKKGRCAYRSSLDKIRRVRSMLWWREEFKDISTRYYYIIRLYTLRLAELYRQQGILDDAGDIWHLKIADISSFMDGGISRDRLRGIAARNRMYYESFRNYTIESELGEAHGQPAPRQQRQSSGGVQGIGCNSGVVTGRARVIESLDEMGRLRAGDILVTKFTDTGWTGKFTAIKALVTEHGGILCHGAVIAREYGIPCVVCAKGATKRIRDGCLITVNGASGQVIIMEER